MSFALALHQSVIKHYRNTATNVVSGLSELNQLSSKVKELNILDYQDRNIYTSESISQEGSTEALTSKIKQSFTLKLKPYIKDKSLAHLLFLSKLDFCVFKQKAPIFLFTKTYRI